MRRFTDTVCKFYHALSARLASVDANTIRLPKNIAEMHDDIKLLIAMQEQSDKKISKLEERFNLAVRSLNVSNSKNTT